jgi:hypothetical protein
LTGSFISSQLKRTGDILRRGASEQIADYARRFGSITGVYDGLLKSLIRRGFSVEDAAATAREFFGSEKVRFAAVDGTEYTQPMFDLVIFYGGSYAARGILEFSDDGVRATYSTKFSEEGISVSSCVPMYVNEIVDVEQAYMERGEGGNVTVDRPLTDDAVINNASIANWIMTFSELYLAYRLAKQSDVKILLLDRSLCAMHGNLVYDTRRRRLWDTCAILGCEVDGRPIDDNDLAYNRHRIVNSVLRLPPVRGDYLRYALVYLLEDKGLLNVDEICAALDVDSKDRRRRVQRFLSRSVAEGYLEERRGLYGVAQAYQGSWNRVKRLVEAFGRHLFEETPSGNPLRVEKAGKTCWLTTLDMAFLSLFCLYMLIEACWRRRILLLGITKDTTARDFKTHLLPVCLNEKIWRSALSQEALKNAPNTDRMLLQYLSIYNYETLTAPWALIEYDSAFRMIIPELEKRRPGYVSGAVRNRITPEKTFLKAYIQLAEAKTDPRLRSNVLFIDRLVYPEYDLREETIIQLKQVYGGAVEPVDPLLFPSYDVENQVQNLVMEMLTAMADSSIPEVFGHNMPLFIADKVAKWHNSEVRRIIDSTRLWIANNRDLRRFVFYMSTFRERRGELESMRRTA